MENMNMNKIFTATLLGFGLGVLFAPKAGNKTREELMKKTEQARDKAVKLTDKARNKWEDLHKDTKDKIDTTADRLLATKSDQPY